MFRRVLLATMASLCVAGSASAGIFADNAVSYSSGTLGAFAAYNNADTAEDGLTNNVNSGDPFGPGTPAGMLTPFNATWQSTDMVGIGPGGHLTLHLGRTASRIGVHAGVGLNDIAWPSGQATSPPALVLYTDPRQATVSVSSDGTTFHSLGLVTFDIPSNYYDEGIFYDAGDPPNFGNPPSNATVSGTHVANFEQAFLGTLSDFYDGDWTHTLAVLSGSAGGEWLDVTGVLPGGANYVRFDVTSGQMMFVDAVATVAAVPEPVGAVLLLLSSVALLRRR